MLRSLCSGLIVMFAASLQAADKPQQENKRPAVKTGFDLVPVNAAAAFSVHNLTEFQAQGDVFLKNTGLEKQFGFRPSQIFTMGFAFVGLNRGRDDSAPAGIFIANLIESRVLNPMGGNEMELLVVAVGFSDRDAIAANFGLAKGELLPETMTKITPIKGGIDLGKFLYTQGNHLYLGNNERAILSVVRGKRLSEVLTKPQMQRVARSDLILHLGTTAWGVGWAQAVQEVKKQVKTMKDKGQEIDPDTGLSAEMIELMAQCMPAVQNFMFTAGIDEKGFELNQMTLFHPQAHPAVGKLLTMLRSWQKIPPPWQRACQEKCRLKRTAVMAQNRLCSPGDVAQSGFGGALLEVGLQVWIRESKLRSVADQPEFVGLFDEVWQRLKGSQMAVYQNEKPDENGLFSILAILDTEDPKEFLSQMRQLSRFAKPGELKLDGEDRVAKDVATVEQLIEELGDRNFRVRQSATLKLSLIGPPALPFVEQAAKSKNPEVAARARRIRHRITSMVEARKKDVLSQSLLEKLSARWGDFPNAETRNGVPIDIVKMDLTGESQAYKPQLESAFGPQWSKIRLAVHEKKIVVLLGSNVDLLEETLTNLKTQKPGLAEYEMLAEFHERAPEDRRTEFHLILNRFLPYIQNTKPIQTPNTKPEMSSLSLGITQDAVELHFWIPNSEFRVFSRF